MARIGIDHSARNSETGKGTSSSRPSPETSKRAAVAQLVERVLGKDEVMGPSPISSSL